GSRRRGEAAFEHLDLTRQVGELTVDPAEIDVRGRGQRRGPQIAGRIRSHDLQRSALRRLARGRCDARRGVGVARGAEHLLIGAGGRRAGADRGVIREVDTDVGAGADRRAVHAGGRAVIAVRRTAVAGRCLETDRHRSGGGGAVANGNRVLAAPLAFALVPEAILLLPSPLALAPLPVATL